MNPQRIRLAFNTRRKGGTVDSLTGVTPYIARGYPANVEVCLIDLDVMEDIADVSTLTLRVIPLGDLTAAALFTVDLSADTFGEGVTKAEWDEDEGWQARFELTSIQTAQSLGGATEAYIRFLVTATDIDGNVFPWGYSDVRIIEIGRASTSAAGDPEVYDTITTSDAKYQPLKASDFYLPVWNSGAAPTQWVPMRIISDGGMFTFDLGDPES